MDVAVTGSSGLIGTELRRALAVSGHRVVRVVRSSSPGRDEIGWDPMAARIDDRGLEGIDAVVHLAGESIGGSRWTVAQKARILDSRVLGTGLLARTIAELQDPPAVFASGSAIGFYGDRGDEELTEAGASGEGFLADVVRQWEEATAPAETAGIRVAHLRSGIALSAAGGALGKMLLPFKLAMGGRIGSGRQWFSWIAIQDEVAAILHVLGSSDITGPVNLTSPQPVTQAEFARTLGRVLGRPTILPTPTPALKILFGTELTEETLLAGQRVLPEKLLATGYRFVFERLEDALRSVLARPA